MDFFNALDELTSNHPKRTLKNISNNTTETDTDANVTIKKTAVSLNKSFLNDDNFGFFGSQMDFNLDLDNEEEDEDGDGENDNDDDNIDLENLQRLGLNSSLIASVRNRLQNKQDKSGIQQERLNELVEESEDEPEVNLDSDAMFDNPGFLSQMPLSRRAPGSSFNYFNSSPPVEDEVDEIDEREELEDRSNEISLTQKERDSNEELQLTSDKSTTSNETQAVTQGVTQRMTLGITQGVTQGLTGTAPASLAISQAPAANVIDEESDEEVLVYRPNPHTHSNGILEEEDDEDEIMTKPKAKPTSKSRLSLFVPESDEDSDIEQNEPQPQVSPLKKPDESTSTMVIDVSKIPGYDQMSVSEKIEARVKERQRLAEANVASSANEQLDDGLSSSDIDIDENEVAQPTVVETQQHAEKEAYIRSGRKLTKKQIEEEEIKDLVKINEMKKNFEFQKKLNASKFSTSNFLEDFDKDSDEEDTKQDDDNLFSTTDVQDSPLTSPIKNQDAKLKTPVKAKQISFTGPLKKYTETLNIVNKNKEKVVQFDNDSSDSEDDRKYVSKSKIIELHMKFGAKQLKAARLEAHLKKSSSKDAVISGIRESFLMQSKENSRGKASNNREAEDSFKDHMAVAKLIENELAANKRIRQQEKERAQSRRNKAKPTSQVDGEQEDDESSNYDESESESESDSEVEVEEEKNTEEVIIEQEEEVSFDIGGAPVLSLSDAFAMTLPDNKSFDGLEGTQVAKKLKELEINKGLANQSMEIEGDQTSDWSVMPQMLNRNDTSNLTFGSDNEADDEDAENNEQEEFLTRQKLLDSQNFLPDTQADTATQKTSRRGSSESLSFGTQPDIANNAVDKDEDDDDEDEAIKKSSRRKRFGKAMDSIVEEQEPQDQQDSSDEEVYEEEETEEQKQLRILKVKAAKQREREKRRKREKEMKKKGLNTVMDQEAVESEDEWFGIGGRDGENSDDMNSEDEKMLDDGSKIDVDLEQIRQMLLDDNMKADNAMVEKIYSDWKSGNFRNRRAKDGAYDLDLSDDDDDNILKRLAERARRQRLEEEARLNSNNSKNVNSKQKAFFDAMNDPSTSSFKIEEETSFLVDVSEEDEDNEKENEDPFRVANDSASQAPGPEVTFEAPIANPPPAKKKIKLSREHVQKALSFLDDIDHSPKAYKQFSNLDSYDMDGTEALKELRQNSIIRSAASSRSSSIVGKPPKRTLVSKKRKHSAYESLASDGEETQELGQPMAIPLPKYTEVDDEADAEDDLDMGMGVGMLAMRGKSITSSFKKFNSLKSKEVRTGTTVHKQVNVTTTSRPTFGSKSSVTYLTKSMAVKTTIDSASALLGSKTKAIQDSVRLTHKLNQKSGIQRLHSNDSFK